jgi:hypothetical protein
MKFSSAVLGILAVSALVPSLARAGDLPFRYDFEGAWRSSHGGTYEIYQNGTSSATMAVTEPNYIEPDNRDHIDVLPTQNFSILFGREAEIPNSYIQNLSNRDIGTVKLDFLKAGTYNAELKVTDAGSEIDGKFEADMAIGDYEFTVIGGAKAFVPKKEKFEKCEGVYRPRAITFSISGLQLKDKSQANEQGFVHTVKAYMVSLGLRVGLGRLTYSDTLIKVDPHPAQTAKALERCAFLDDEVPNPKYVPAAQPDAELNKPEGKTDLQQ